MHVDLRGRNALVTGAARGLGAAITRRLTEAGAMVWAADVREGELKELARELGAEGRAVQPLLFDIRETEQVAAAVEDVWRASGSLEILVNNAAVDVGKPIRHLSPEEADLVISTNLLGPIRLCLENYRRMIGQGGGHIVNILSTSAERTWTEAGPYAASKTGLRAFTHTLFKEAQRDCLGIAVTGIITGGMRTPFVLDRLPQADPSKLQDPDIVADTVMYALSVPAGSVVGELVIVPRNEPTWP